VIMELAHNWADWPATQRHYELMARYVHPHFQGSRELRSGSYAYALVAVAVCAVFAVAFFASIGSEANPAKRSGCFAQAAAR